MCPTQSVVGVYIGREKVYYALINSYCFLPSTLHSQSNSLLTRFPSEPSFIFSTVRHSYTPCNCRANSCLQSSIYLCNILVQLYYFTVVTVAKKARLVKYLKPVTNNFLTKKSHYV